MVNQVLVHVKTSKGTWETTFQKSTRIKDVILGSRMNGTQIGTANKFAPNAKKILIDIDENELKEENKVKK